MKIEHLYTNACLWEGEAESIRDAVAKALAAKANLEGADLEGANLEGANLECANLRGANLEGANLEGADLEGADLRGANLRGANLECANLEGVNLRGANLECVNLRGANLEGANLEGANLEGVNLRGAKIRRILQIGPIGSRGATLVVWAMEDGSFRYSTGCQNHITEEAFRSRVVAAHNGNEHGRAYMEAIEFAHRVCAIYHPVEVTKCD